jgi:hypothetical protein
VTHFGEMNETIYKSYILDIPYELFHLICEFLPLADVKTCTGVNHNMRDWVIGSQIYQSPKYKKVVGPKYAYVVAKLGYLNILKSLSTTMDRKLYFAAFRGNCPEIVAWLLEKKIVPKPKISRFAITKSYMEIFQLVLTPGITSSKLKKLIYIIVQYNNLNALKILEEKYPPPI